MNIQSNLDANSKARARSWRLLKLEEAIAHREAGKYPISSDILDKTIDELKEIDSCYSKLALNNDYEAFWDKLYSYADKNMKQ